MTDYRNIERRFIDGRIVRRDTNAIDKKMEGIVSDIAGQLLWDLDNMCYEHLNGAELTDNKIHILYEKLTTRLTREICTS